MWLFLGNGQHLLKLIIIREPVPTTLETIEAEVAETVEAEVVEPVEAGSKK
jgi:hypothetical protein